MTKCTDYGGYVNKLAIALWRKAIRFWSQPSNFCTSSQFLKRM
ncbi:MAG: hypothetical protein O4805_10225 [Trichodesmium sp. St16_bin2-tuft]|nr:hypothetical protein [Trichodesmium sp. St5_bin2_1]MDE5084473.1 hypothetical protein [Trichodesmium sp. St18_bin1]MDE5087496.1 hypothetical protein [Trichodesmium sp. St16_bin2-tuft]MDE5109999.1 hypothetical protein [Trichodesmium sp. St7_bin2_1]MDE5122721.1 hypothetical protein [Trichodesmium sp. St19_bin1]